MLGNFSQHSLFDIFRPAWQASCTLNATDIQPQLLSNSYITGSTHHSQSNNISLKVKYFAMARAGRWFIIPSTAKSEYLLTVFGMIQPCDSHRNIYL